MLRNIPPSLQAIFLMIGAMFLYVTSDTISKILLSGDFFEIKINSFFLMWVRYLSQVVLVFLIIPKRALGFFKFDKNKKHIFLRGIFFVLTTYSFLQALKTMPLSNLTAMSYTSPIFLAILAHIFLKEKMPFFSWVFVFVAFVGVLFVAVEKGFVADKIIIPETFWGLLSVMFYSIGQLVIRIQTIKNIKVDSWESLFWLALLSFLSLSCFLWIIWTNMSLLQTLLSILGGLLSFFGSLCMFTAFTKAPSYKVAPFEYSRLVWVTFYSVLVFNALPSLNTLIGILLIIVATIGIGKTTK